MRSWPKSGPTGNWRGTCWDRSYGRDRLPIGLAAHLGAQLPILVRGIYYDQWRASEQPQKWRSLDEFLGLVSADLRNVRSVNPTEAAQAVFQLNHYVEPGQVAKVRDALPEDVRQLWPANALDARPAA
jgi:uncharacterized protein (DUF2267 family)